jgi:hypothetical protein
MQSSFQNQAITQRVGRRPLTWRILDADEAEDRAQVDLLKVVGLLRRSRRIKTTARRGNEHPFGASFAGAARLAGDDNAVEPCFGDREATHEDRVPRRPKQ